MMSRLGIFLLFEGDGGYTALSGRLFLGCSFSQGVALGYDTLAFQAVSSGDDK
jgi:hypothetical protein